MSIFDFFRSLLKYFFTKKNDDDDDSNFDDNETVYLNNPMYDV